MRIYLRTILAILNLLLIIAAISSPLGITRSDNFTRLPPSISTLRRAHSQSILDLRYYYLKAFANYLARAWTPLIQVFFDHFSGQLWLN